MRESEPGGMGFQKGTFIRMHSFKNQTMMRLTKFALFCCAALCCAGLAGPLAAQAPSFDTSGNGMLNGTYYFRHVTYVISTSADAQDITGDISRAIALYGNITFDGNGNYSIASNAQISDSGYGPPTALSCYEAGTSCATGTAVAGLYAISASGFGYIVNPVTGDFIYGLVSGSSIFAGSSTQNASSYNDLLIAAPLASPTPTLGTFQGTYSVTGFLPGGSPLTSADAFFQMTADGNGNLGTVNVNGYDGAGSTIGQSNSNMKYFFSNGAAVVEFPTSSTANFYSGSEYLYFSPDGNFFFGGSPSPDSSSNSYGYDMIIGVRNGSGTQNFTGLYYEAGLDEDFSQLTSTGGYVDFDGYYGALNATSTGTIIAEDHVDDIFGGVTGNSYTDTFTPPVTGTYTDSNSLFQYAVGDGGAIRIGQGIWPELGITVALQAPTFTPTGSVYVDPTGIVNAASFAPFTEGISDGEFLTAYGTNLAPSSCAPCIVSTADFDKNNAYPTTFQGVQVLINGVVNAPIYFVAPGQIAFIVPADTPQPLASIQVINNGVASNAVDAVVNPTTPGIYTAPEGVGYGRIVDITSGQVLNASTPAQPGDTIEVYATGLGTAYPPVADGAAPPSSPLSKTVNTITAFVGGTAATVGFAGLAPTLAGLYQVNVTIPTGLASGVYTLDIAGPDSYNSQALIAIGTAAAADRQPKASSRRHPLAGPAVKRSCMFRGQSICGVETLRGRARGLE
jgi:uncharacterized protein (TIGR03437 family)